VFAAPPPLPFSPYGTVKVNNINVPSWIIISAQCGGETFRQTTTLINSGESWYFNLNIPGDNAETPGVKEGCTANETVTFKIGDLTALQTAPWVPAGTSRINITATGAMPTPSRTPTYLPLMLR
jgi:hypothetical protein